MGSHKLAQACTSLFKYKLISEEAADRTVEPPCLVWQDGRFFWFVGFLGFFFWLSFFTHSVKALQWPHSGCAAETCEHHCAAQEAWLSCLLAETGNMSGDPRHSFIFSNTQTTFFFFPRDIYSKESIGIMFLFDFFASVTLGLNDLSPHDNLFNSQENLTVKQPRSCRASGVVVGVGRIDFLSNRKGSSSFWWVWL